VAPPPDPRGQELALIPGIAGRTFFATQDRTVLAYLMKPMNDQMQRIFRE